MKSLTEILAQKPVFLHNWSDRFKVIADFENVNLTEEAYNSEKSPWPNEEYWREEKDRMKPALEKHEGENILFASYGTDNYCGDAWVMFEKDGKLYEVNASHCSCYGVEDQWQPEEVVLAELETRLANNSFGRDEYSDNAFAEELKQFLGLCPQ